MGTTHRTEREKEREVVRGVRFIQGSVTWFIELEKEDDLRRNKTTTLSVLLHSPDYLAQYERSSAQFSDLIE